MPKSIKHHKDINIGDLYEDSAYHPCLCVGVEEFEVWGISLIDGSYPRSEDIQLSGIRKLSTEEAWEWKIKGPQDVEIEKSYQWW